MTQKVLKINQVVIDEKLYPRDRIEYITVSRYANAMKSGAKFPPIQVAKLKGRYVLVDGGHRLEAMKKNGEKVITAEVLENLSELEIYKLAIQTNIGHGRQFTTHEVVKIAISLQEWGSSLEEVSALVQIPIKELTPFLADRTTSATSNEGISRLIALKAPLQNLAGGNLTESGGKDLEKLQDRIGGRSQINLLDNLIVILKNRWLNIESEQIMNKSKQVYKYLGEYLGFEKGKKKEKEVVVE